MLDRLAGLETEYAIRYGPADLQSGESRFGLYQRLVERLRRLSPLVRAYHFKDGWFFANGGAVWFEAERPAAGAGLIEGSTPECRGAYQLLTYQRALDAMLSESAASSDGAGPFWLLKNDRDAHGHVYGGQENYEVAIGSGAALAAWRAGLVAVLPLVILSWIGFYLLVALVLLYLCLAGVVFLLFGRWVPNRVRLAKLLFGRDIAEGRETGGATPAWMETCLLHATRILSAPLAIALWAHCHWFAFRATRQRLTPFLVSRSVLAGAGYVTVDGKFALADKAPAINCLVGFGGYLGDRPLYTMGHFFKALCAECLFSFRNYVSLFAPKQRLQVGLGDSNMCERAEFLKIGTTLLVLDAIEAGFLPQVPRLRHPIDALHAIATDPSLRCEVLLTNGSRVSALELQRFYFEACRRYVESQTQPSPEAVTILRMWEDVLEALVEYRLQADSTPRSAALLPLVGTLDWATKYYLLGKLDKKASWAEKKKIDIRYHELSPDGYYHRLVQSGVVPRVVRTADLERATRVAPPNSPATRRGHFIREFCDGDHLLRVNWRWVIIGQGRSARVISLDGKGTTTATTRTTPHTQRPSSGASHSVGDEL